MLKLKRKKAMVTQWILYSGIHRISLIFIVTSQPHTTQFSPCRVSSFRTSSNFLRCQICHIKYRVQYPYTAHRIVCCISSTSPHSRECVKFTHPSVRPFFHLAVHQHAKKKHGQLHFTFTSENSAVASRMINIIIMIRETDMCTKSIRVFRVKLSRKTEKSTWKLDFLVGRQEE